MEIQNDQFELIQRDLYS